MIYDVFLPLIIILSIVGIIIILARKIPDISLEVEEKKDWISEDAKKQHRATVLFCKTLSILEKTLRQIRIHILKLDAKIFNLIQYLRDKSAEKLEEINKFSYKNFVPLSEKKAGKLKPEVKTQVPFFAKPQIARSDIKTTAVVHPKTLASHPFVLKIVKTPERQNNILTKNQFEVEEKKLLHIIARNPKKAENYKNLGMLYYNNKNLSDAEAAFDEYLKLNSSDSEVKEMIKKISVENQKKDTVLE